jgi:hypothetical protein
MPSLPPRRSDTPRQPVCDMPCSLHPGRRDSAFGTIFLRGHFWVHSRYGLMTRSPSHGWLCRLASSASFPPRMQPKLQGSVSYPGGTPLPLNMPAFTGRARPQKICPQSSRRMRSKSTKPGRRSQALGPFKSCNQEGAGAFPAPLSSIILEMLTPNSTRTTRAMKQTNAESQKKKATRTSASSPRISVGQHDWLRDGGQAISRLPMLAGSFPKPSTPSASSSRCSRIACHPDGRSVRQRMRHG